MKSSSSAKATMASKLRSISLRDKPSSEAFKKTLSRPDISGWKPAPSSSIAARWPRSRICPDVGCRMPAMHLSSVDFPEPLRPRMPRVSPGLISSSMSFNAQNSSKGTLPACTTRSFSDVYFSL